MKTALILHGKPSKEEYFDPESPSPSNGHWLPWIQRQLLLKGILSQTPELPEPYEPSYEKWRDVFERFEVNNNTILIGHSCGAGFLVRWLSENNVNVGKVALVAPWLDPTKELNTGFFNFDIDSDLVSRTDGLTAMYSTDDPIEGIHTTTDLLKEKLKDARFQEFSNKGHFCFCDMHTKEFPELLSAVIGE